MSNKGNLREVASVFLKLGTIAFGGPAAHIALMEREIVQKRKWITPEHFLDLVSATNLIPGPNSTEMAMHCGHERAGFKGLLVAGALFIMPAVAITSFFAWLYMLYGGLPTVQPFLVGIKPAVIAIIAGTLYNLGKKALKNTTLMLLMLFTVVACFLGLHEIIAFFSCGVLGLLLYWLRRGRLYCIGGLLLIEPMIVSAGKIFWIFLKVGALLYGSGYVLFAFLDAELVAKGLLSRQELVDAVAVGQFTPGPVLSTATFIGWQMHGVMGAILATVGIFLPSFAFVVLLNPLIPKMRRSKPFSAFLDAVNVASVAVLFVVCVNMGREAILDWRTAVIAVVSLAVFLAFKNLSSAIIIAGGAAIGYFLSSI
ncbi:putative chromate transport protein [compost metagenome]